MLELKFTFVFYNGARTKQNIADRPIEANVVRVKSTSVQCSLYVTFTIDFTKA